MSGPDYFGFSVQSARDAFIKGVVDETLEKHGIGRRTEPVCKACGGTMRRICDVSEGTLYQCAKCGRAECL